MLSEIPKAIASAGQNDQAATRVYLMERWLRDHPDDVLATHAYAEMLYQLTRYDEAINVYTAAIDRFEDDRWGTYNQLGHLYRYRGSFSESEHWYRKATEEDPDEAISFIFLGSVQARQGNLKQAEESYRRATGCTDAWNVDEAFHNLGLVLRGQGRFAEAAECFRKALEINPKYKDATSALEDVTQVVKLLGDEGMLSEVRKAITYASRNDQAATFVYLAERWLRDHPNDVWVTLEYAEMLYKLTRYDEAIGVYTAAIDRFQDHRWLIYNKLGQLYRDRGSFSDSEHWHRKATEEDPNDAGSFIFLGAVQARQGHLKQAEESHRLATGCTEGCVDEAFHNLGLVLRGQGRFAEAAECFRKALEINPEYEDATEALEDVTRVGEAARGRGWLTKP